MKIRLTLCLLAAGLVTLSRAQAQVPEGPGIDLEVYGTLYPFTEYTSTSGAKAGADANLDGRLRMRIGTSNIGFKGDLRIVDNLKLVWQVESAVPLDGDSPPTGTFASRNSHVGLAGDFGTVIFGLWDTPWKWAHVTTINPIRAGYDWDYTMVLSTPGFGVNAVAGTPASFERRAANSIQYWSPDLSGFTARLAFSLNEGRTQANPAAMPPVVASNPYLLSGMVNYENSGFRIRYVFEYHKDFFGLSQLGGNGVSGTNPSSTDMGHQLDVQYKTPSVDAPTRIVVAGEILQYQDDDTAAGAIKKFSRTGAYALVEQAFGPHHVFGAFGMGLAGSCDVAGGGDCTAADKTGALYLNLGYLYALSGATNVHVAGYTVINDENARFGSLPGIAAGADQIGVGVGIIHVFNVGLIGAKK